MKVPSFEVKRNLCTTNVHHPSPAIVDGGQKKKKEAKTKKATHTTQHTFKCLIYIQIEIRAFYSLLGSVKEEASV